jgi:hypothetical protein
MNGQPVVEAATGIETRPPLRCRSAIDDGLELEGCLVSTKPMEDPHQLWALFGGALGAALLIGRLPERPAPGRSRKTSS